MKELPDIAPDRCLFWLGSGANRSPSHSAYLVRRCIACWPPSILMYGYRKNAKNCYWSFAQTSGHCASPGK